MRKDTTKPENKTLDKYKKTFVKKDLRALPISDISNKNIESIENIENIENTEDNKLLLLAPRVCTIASYHSPTFSGRVASELLLAARSIEMKFAAEDRISYAYQKEFSIAPFIEKVLDRPNTGRFRLWVMPTFLLPEEIEKGNYWAITAFDPISTNIKALKKLREIRRIWVPSKNHADALSKAGISDSAIRVFSIPVNVRNFHPRMSCPKNFEKAPGVFRFIISGSPLKRKGIEDALHAYIKEFRTNEKVELVIKLTHLPKIKKDFSYEITDLRKKLGALNKTFAKVTVISETLADRDYAGLLASANAYIATGHSFNSGITVKEAMACALPIIAPDYLAPEIGLSAENSWLLDSESIETKSGELFVNSPAVTLRRIKPDKLSETMRKAFTECNKARKMGLAGQRKLKKQPQWKDFAIEITKFAKQDVNQA